MELLTDQDIQELCTVSQFDNFETYKPMIYPFVDTQIEHGKISYGLSSFGYDMRVSNEFKVFTNVWNTVVDPKQLDERSFVDQRIENKDGNYCLIPPNSFALARSLEHFNIPDTVLALVTGKSTYARCFHGSTKVALVDGRSLSLEEMASKQRNDEPFYGYSVDENGRIAVCRIENPRYVGNESILEITLDNGDKILCTPDHEFLIRDQGWMSADQLRPNDSLFPLYRKVHRDYEQVYQPLQGVMNSTYRLSDEWNIRHMIYADELDTHRHHIDHNKQNNRPDNITRINASDHIKYHNGIYFGDEFDSVKHGRKVIEAYEINSQNEEWMTMFRESQRKKATAFWHDDKHEETRERLLHRRKNPSEETRELMRRSQLERYKNPEEKEKVSRTGKLAWSKDDGTRRSKASETMKRVNIRTRHDITEIRVREALQETGTIRGAARILDCDRATFRRFPHVLEEFKKSHNNHKIISIRTIKGSHDVFCLTVPEFGNFALESGVFVKNCGIISNVTPLEPGWRGYVTLEISNTTPLPAKIYINEGICQVLFFRSDKRPLRTYADKKGKYQNQVGIVLPTIKKRGSDEL